MLPCPATSSQTSKNQRNKETKEKIMGNASSVKTNQVPKFDKNSTATYITEVYGKAAIGKHVIVTGEENLQYQLNHAYHYLEILHLS